MAEVLLIEAVHKAVSDTESRYPPLQLAYLATYASQHLDLDVEIVTSDGDDILGVLEGKNPRLAGITAVSQNYDVALSIASSIKQYRKDILVVVGGHHITALPTTLNQDMDVAVLGEGELTFLELIKLDRQNGFCHELLSRIPGIAYRREGELIATQRRPQLKELDRLPIPSRTSIGLNPNDAHLFTSRGCPFKCSFCSSSHFWKSCRFHSPERVRDEIRDLVFNWKVTQINVFDDSPLTGNAWPPSSPCSNKKNSQRMARCSLIVSPEPASSTRKPSSY